MGGSRLLRIVDDVAKLDETGIFTQDCLNEMHFADYVT